MRFFCFGEVKPNRCRASVWGVFVALLVATFPLVTFAEGIEYTIEFHPELPEGVSVIGCTNLENRSVFRNRLYLSCDRELTAGVDVEIRGVRKTLRILDAFSADDPGKLLEFFKRAIMAPRFIQVDAGRAVDVSTAPAEDLTVRFDLDPAFHNLVEFRGEPIGPRLDASGRMRLTNVDDPEMVNFMLGDICRGALVLGQGDALSTVSFTQGCYRTELAFEGEGKLSWLTGARYDGAVCETTQGGPQEAVQCFVPNGTDRLTIQLAQEGWQPMTVRLEDGLGAQRLSEDQLRPALSSDHFIPLTQGDRAVCEGVETVETGGGLSLQFYCAADGAVCSPGDGLPLDPENPEFPSLGDLSWSHAEMPEFVRLSVGGNAEDSFDLPFGQSPEETATFLDSRNRTPARLAILTDDGVPFDRDSSLHFYSDQNCTVESNISASGSNPLTSLRYVVTADEKRVRVPACLYAQVRRQDSAISECGRVDITDGTATVQLAAAEVKKRLFVLVARTQNLKPLSRSILNGIDQWVSTLRESQSALPITIGGIREDGRVVVALTAEDLRQTAQSGEDSVLGRLEGIIQFNGDAQRPLRDLADLDNAYSGVLDKILYVIDDTLPDAGSIRGSELGAPLFWNATGVEFAVVAPVEDCSAWETRIFARACFGYGETLTADELESHLDSFFGIGG